MAWQRVLVAGHGVPLFLLVRAGEVARLVVSGDNEEGLLPVGVLLDPVDGGIDRLVEVLDFLDLTSGVVGVAGPVDGAALNHDREAVLVLAQHVERTLGHGGQIHHVVLRVGVRGLAFTGAALLQRRGDLRGAPVLGAFLDLTSGKFVKALVRLHELPVGLAAGERTEVLFGDVVVGRGGQQLVRVIVERVASTHDNGEI